MTAPTDPQATSSGGAARPRAATRRAFLAALGTLSGGAALLAGAAASAQTNTTVASTAQDTTARTVAAANAFLATLTDAQRAAVNLPYPTDQTTASAANFGFRVGEQFGASVWSNYPISDVIRPGLRLGDLTDPQWYAAQALVAATLSQRGYRKVLDIMDADQVLANGGTMYASGADNYVIGIFGTPSDTARWMLQYGGHHLGLNVVMQGAAVVLAPMLTGCQPSTYTRQGQTVHPLGAETDKAFALLNALDAAQQKQAILSYSVTDLVLGPGHDGMVLQPEGIAAASMNAAQQGLLLDLIGEWVGILADPAAGGKMADIRARLPETYFAWSGATAAGSAVYFRVTGPTLHIEFAHQGGGPGGGMMMGGQQNPAETGGVNHIHTVYRDPTNDYGTGLT